MPQDSTTLAEILESSARLNEMVERGGFRLRFPTSRAGSSPLGALKEDRRAVDYIVQTEEPEHGRATDRVRLG